MATGLIAQVASSDARPIANAHISINDLNNNLLYIGQTDTTGIAELEVIEISDIWPPYPGVVLRRGMTGPSIRQAQERLNELGANPRLATDGATDIIGLNLKSDGASTI